MCAGFHVPTSSPMCPRICYVTSQYLGFTLILCTSGSCTGAAAGLHVRLSKSCRMTDRNFQASLCSCHADHSGCVKCAASCYAAELGSHLTQAKISCILTVHRVLFYNISPIMLYHNHCTETLPIMKSLAATEHHVGKQAHITATLHQFFASDDCWL